MSGVRSGHTAEIRRRRRAGIQAAAKLRAKTRQCPSRREGLVIERAYEMSHIRRGRLATSPTWFVCTGDGTRRWRFQRKKDAQRFVAAGGVCSNHDARGFCYACNGSQVIA